MLFHTWEFIVFFLVYVVLHRYVPVRHQLWLIIFAGSFFYAWWNPAFLWLPHLLAIIGWVGVKWLNTTNDPGSRKFRLIVALGVLLMPLILFKYAHFIYLEIFTRLFSLPPLNLRFGLPLGISFITFSMVAYLVDCYRADYKSESRFLMVNAFMIYFPHQIAGPILRPKEIIPQLKRIGIHVNGKILLGAALFTLGLVKKVIFADQLAPFVDRTWEHLGTVSSGWEYLLALYGFSVQIYCDFSGYTDMAIGVALIIGVKLPINFNRPYSANSIANFWRRWHITLSNWIRDYIYIPLGGNRTGPLKRAKNVILTMAIAGLWHGANWTFLLWGLLHGFFIALTQWVVKNKIWHQLSHRAGRAWDFIAIFVTFHIITALWILFRAPSVEDAKQMVAGLVTANWSAPANFLDVNMFPIMLLFMFAIGHKFDTHSRVRWLIARTPMAVILVAILILTGLAVALSTGSSAKFIYFDF